MSKKKLLFLILFKGDKNGWREIARTETIDDNLNPEFAKTRDHLLNDS